MCVAYASTMNIITGMPDKLVTELDAYVKRTHNNRSAVIRTFVRQGLRAQCETCDAVRKIVGAAADEDGLQAPRCVDCALPAGHDGPHGWEKK